MVYPKRKNTKGFTLIEIMVTACVLAFGLVPLHQSFLTALETFSLYAHTLNAQSWFDEKIWDAKKELMENELLASGQSEGRFVRQYKEYNWSVRTDMIDPDQGLYRLNLVLAWTEGQKTRSTSRMAYILAPLKAKAKTEAAAPVVPATVPVTAPAAGT